MISISDILAIIDKLFALINRRSEDRQHLFQTLAMPVFEELLTVHADYIKMFEETLQDLRNSEKGIIQIADRLRQRRLEFEPVRVKLRALSRSLQEIKGGKPYKDFVWSVIVYFPRGELLKDPSGATRILDALEKWNEETNLLGPNGKEIKQPREELITIVETTISAHRLSWSLVCESYARLRTHVNT